MTYPGLPLRSMRATALCAILSASAFLFTIQVPIHADKLIAPTAETAIPGIVEDTNEDWTWTGMQTVVGAEYHKGSVRAGGAPTMGVYLFLGTGVKIFGVPSAKITVDGKEHLLGKMAVTIDGKPKSVIDLSTPSTNPESRIFEVSALPVGNHVLEVKVTEGWGAVDYITVQNEDDGGKDYRISPKHAPDKWLDSETNSMDDDSALVIFSGPRHGHTQIWHVVSLGKGEYRISPKEKPEQAVTLVTRQAQINGTGQSLGGLYKYAGAPAQQWQLVPSDAGYYRIVNTLDHRCLNVGGEKTENGSAVILYQLTNGNNDQWRFVPVP